MPDYAPHGNYAIRIDPDHDRVIRVEASGSVNLELLQLHNERTNAIVDGFRGRRYGMVCDFGGGMLMTPDGEDAWIRSAAGRVARGWSCVAFFFNPDADYKSLVCDQVTRVFETAGVPWYEAENEASALLWVVDRLKRAGQG